LTGCISWPTFDYKPDHGVIVAINLDREIVVKEAFEGWHSRRICFGTVDVVLFNPLTSQYDGPRLSDLPIGFTWSLGFRAALEEARSIAIAHICRSAVAGSAVWRERETLACIGRIRELSDVQGIARALESLVHDACGVAASIRAREFEVERGDELTRRIQEQAVL
jgi:hypothetical protein